MKRDRNTLLRFHSSRGSVIQRLTLLFFFFLRSFPFILKWNFLFAFFFMHSYRDRQTKCAAHPNKCIYTHFTILLPSHGFNHRSIVVHVSLSDIIAFTCQLHFFPMNWEMHEHTETTQHSRSNVQVQKVFVDENSIWPIRWLHFFFGLSVRLNSTK